MKQYLELLQTIKEKGTYKPAAREGIPGTQSLFGYQFRHDLQSGFPLLTTKKMFWKGVVVELLWFLRGDTNIKYLVDNGVNIWNEDAYNYYCKLRDKYVSDKSVKVKFEDFISIVKEKGNQEHSYIPNYKWGDCGFQYGKVWRNWQGVNGDIIKIKTDHLSQENIDDFKKQWLEYSKSNKTVFIDKNIEPEFVGCHIDQIKNLIEGLKKNPESRRHIVTAWDPAHDQDLALTWCHALFQFNCRPLTALERSHYAVDNSIMHRNELMFDVEKTGLSLEEQLNENNIPKYYLDCQLYQRSADVVLGVPFNIASYALLTHIIAKICNMIPGEFIHTFGDVHIYDNHKEAVEEQLKRIPTKLPKLNIMFKDLDKCEVDYLLGEFLQKTTHEDFIIENYNPQSKIEAKLSTGLKK